MFVPRLNDAPVVIGDVGKRLEDRNNEKYGLDLQRHEITIICECGMSTLTVNRISAIAPATKRTKNDAHGSANIENHREIVPGIEHAAKHEHTLEHTNSYPNSSRRRIVSDVSLFRYVMRLLEYVGR